MVLVVIYLNCRVPFWLFHYFVKVFNIQTEWLVCRVVLLVFLWKFWFNGKVKNFIFGLFSILVVLWLDQCRMNLEWFCDWSLFKQDYLLISWLFYVLVIVYMFEFFKCKIYKVHSWLRKSICCVKSTINIVLCFTRLHL